MPSPLDSLRDRSFKLPELEAAASQLLARASTDVEDGRVASVPDARTLRYYQSSGLLDRPLRYDGRAAVYGYRSLLQAVCVKLLQAQGLSLGQVQRALAGASNERLEDAVLDAIGTAHPGQAAAPAQPDAGPLVTSLVSVELVPGVVITVDPRQHPDPSRLVRDIHDFLNRRTP